MEATRSNLIVMPACYAVLTEEEMVYVDGGAWFPYTKEDVINFTINFANNAALVIGSISLSMGIEAVTQQIKTVGISQGISNIFGTIAGFNGWQIAGLVVFGACAAYYAYYQVMQIVTLVKALGGAFQQAVDQTAQQSQQNQMVAVA